MGSKETRTPPKSEEEARAQAEYLASKHRLEAARKRGGRPRGREPEPGERVPLSVRVTPEMKLHIAAAALRSGRSQSQEIEYRLERSLERESLLPDVLTLAYGEQLAGVLLLIGDAMERAGEVSAGMVDHSLGYEWADRDWMQYPEEYDQAVQAAVAILEAARPKASSRKIPLKLSGVGLSTARTILNRVRSKLPTTIIGSPHVWTAQRLLGDLVERLVVPPANGEKQ